MRRAIIHTDGGATADPEVGFYAGWGVHIAIENEEKELLIYGAGKHGDTNNRAEQTGYIRAMKWILEEKIEEVRFVLDSRYVIDNAVGSLDTWKRNSWITSQGKAVKNKDLWLAIDTYQEMLNANKVKVEIDWVKGHKGIYGNEMADKGATMGTALARNNDFEERIVDAKSLVEEETKTKKEIKKVKAVDPFGLLCGRRMFEMINAERVYIDGKRAYLTCSYDDTDPIKARGLGVMAGERFEGVVVPNEPLEALDDIIDYGEEIVESPTIRPMVFYWDKIKSAANWKQIARDGRGCFLKKRNNLIFHDAATPISLYLDPPRQARRCAEEMAKKAEILKKINANEIAEEDRIDITDCFFDINDKGKKVIKADLSKEKSVTYILGCDKRKAKIIMSFDYEIPNRNSLAKAAKQGKDIKCELVITDRTENTFRWHFLVTTPVGYGLFNNPATNLFILPH